MTTSTRSTTRRPGSTLTEDEQYGSSIIQVRAAMFCLLLSLMMESVFPLVGGALLVVVFAAYTNGYTNETEASGGAA